MHGYIFFSFLSCSKISTSAIILYIIYVYLFVNRKKCTWLYTIYFFTWSIIITTNIININNIIYDFFFYHLYLPYCHYAKQYFKFSQCQTTTTATKSSNDACIIPEAMHAISVSLPSPGRPFIQAVAIFKKKKNCLYRLTRHNAASCLFLLSWQVVRLKSLCKKKKKPTIPLNSPSLSRGLSPLSCHRLSA